MIKRIILLFLLLSVLLGSCASPSCGEQNVEYVSEIKEILARWDEQDQATWRWKGNSFLMITEMSKLSDILEETDQITPPACAEDVHELFKMYMALELSGYFFIATGEDQEKIDDAFEGAQ